MNCNSYIQLTVVERNELVQKIVHLLQVSEDHFRDLNSVIRQAENNGLFNGLVVMPKNFIVIEDVKDI